MTYVTTYLYIRRENKRKYIIADKTESELYGRLRNQAWRLRLLAAIARDDAVRAWSELLGRLRSRVLAIPDRLAPRMAVITNEREVRALLTTEFADALVVLSIDAI